MLEAARCGTSLSRLSRQKRGEILPENAYRLRNGTYQFLAALQYYASLNRLLSTCRQFHLWNWVVQPQRSNGLDSASDSSAPLTAQNTAYRGSGDTENEVRQLGSPQMSLQTLHNKKNKAKEKRPLTSLVCVQIITFIIFDLLSCKFEWHATWYHVITISFQIHHLGVTQF